MGLPLSRTRPSFARSFRKAPRFWPLAVQSRVRTFIMAQTECLMSCRSWKGMQIAYMRSAFTQQHSCWRHVPPIAQSSCGVILEKDCKNKSFCTLRRLLVSWVEVDRSVCRGWKKKGDHISGDSVILPIPCLLHSEFQPNFWETCTMCFK